MWLHRNVGGLDRMARLIGGPLLIVAGVVAMRQGARYGVVPLALGLAALATGLSGFCVLYLPFGVTTARRDAGEQRGATRH